MHAGQLSLWLAATVALQALVGCGDDSTDPADDAGSADADVDVEDADVSFEAETEAEADVTTGSLVVTVVAAEWPSFERPPIAGAVVGLEAPGGGRAEQTTGADGRVAFHGLHWAAGTAAVTGWHAGHALGSRVGIVEADGDVELPLGVPAYPPAGFVAVSGRALHMADEAHELAVSASLPHDRHAGTGPAWSIDVPPDRAFTLIGVETHLLAAPPSGRGVAQVIDRWTLREHPAVTGPVTADLDFDATTTPTPTTIRGSFPIGLRAESPLALDAYGYFWATTLSSSLTALLALPNRIDVSADGTAFEFEGEYLQLPRTSDPLTVYALTRPATGERSTTVVTGWPASGTAAVTFLDLPTMLVPATPGTRHPLHDPISWTAYDTGLGVVLQVVRDDRTVWTVYGPPDATTLAVPQAPSVADVAGLVGSGLVEGLLTLYRREAAGHYNAQAARSWGISLQP
ncbi:MAG: hypothetical protein JXB32_06915 [Deltaproteobacteria bacterium]|nr:hypothetical protein [Deltaproteobacteria bacterium]